MDTISDLELQQTIVEEPERRDDSGLDQISASRLAKRLHLLRNTFPRHMCS